MITLQEFCQHLDELLEVSKISDYGPSGLQVEGIAEIETFATAVSCNLATIEKAVEMGVQALVVHHGLFWNNDSLEVVGVKKQKLKALLDNHLSLLGYHLPLDAHPKIGNNWKAALDLGWEKLEGFGEHNGTLIGVKGSFSPMAREDFQKKIEEYYGHKAFSSLGGKTEVSSAALVSGGAWRNLSDAAKEGIDCFITGNFDEPAWHMAQEEGVNFFALGHTATEKVGPRALCDYINENLPVKGTFIDDNNPF